MHAMSKSSPAAPPRALREALAAVVDEPDETVFSADARRIRGWLASLG